MTETELIETIGTDVVGTRDVRHDANDDILFCVTGTMLVVLGLVVLACAACVFLGYHIGVGGVISKGRDQS